MADDSDKDTPSLEPPSLFGRKKRKSPAVPAPSPAPEPSEAAQAEPDPEPTTIFEADPEPDRVAVPPQPASTTRQVAEPPLPSAPAPPPTPTSTQQPEPETEPELTGELETSEHEPWLTGGLAAVITGLVVGLLIVVATAGGLRLCTSVKGTDSCGGPGLFLLIAILVVAVLVGAGLLRASRVPEPGSTSFLAVGLLSVVALLFLVGSIFQWWMIIAIPIVSMATYALSHWVTTTYIEPSRD
jgi:hypothetical protein